MAIRYVARKVGPDTSKKAAAKLKSTGYKDVYAALKHLKRATCEQVLFYLKENMPEGKTLREDPVSGMFNMLCLKGMIVPTGKTKRNSSGFEAIVWRPAKRHERLFLRAFVGQDKKAPWPSPDTLLEIEEVADMLYNHPSGKVRKMYRRYCKGVIFKRDFKDNGIKWLMRNYDESGRMKHDV